MAHGWGRVGWVVGLLGCGSASSGNDGSATADGTDSIDPSAGTGSTSGGSVDSGGTTSSPDSTATPTTDADTSGGPKFDVGRDTDGTGTGGIVDVCHVSDDMDAVGECKITAPPDSFEPEVQWSWEGYPGEPDSIVTPLVANLTDDNADGEINLCDIPDILVVASPDWYLHGHMALLDGATGVPHFQFAEMSQWAVTPAIGDIDDDGIPEIVGSNLVNGSASMLAAWEHDGTLKWTSSHNIQGEYAIALADLDTDGDVEIIVGGTVTDHQGTVLFSVPDAPTNWAATTAADLDDDGDLEVVLGRSAYHHDGSQYFLNNAAPTGMPQVADLDDDGLPEILILPGFGSGLSVLEHDGTTKYLNVAPTPDYDWRRPAAIHDLDGDNVSEIAVSSNATYGVYEGDASIVWTAPVTDASGLASGTAFDFLGDGIAEAIYGDEYNLFVFGDGGDVLLQSPRSSGTLIEYPVVADVDNDGSAEIVIVSNEAYGVQTPLLQVVKDVDDRWIQPRRIWNQHTYHVTNVREDGTIPQHEPKHWEHLNTFRTNAQIEGGTVCDPNPEG